MVDTATANHARLAVLDGLRGWAALCVTASHIFWGVFGDLVPLFKNPATGIFLNGLLSVMFFFIISGEALAAAFWAKPGRRAIWRLAVKRYPRLALPVFAACLLVALLTNAGLVFNEAAGEAIGNSWLRDFPTDPKTAYQTVSFALFYVFYKPFIDFSIIPFLWTMRTEAIGSILVVVFLLCQHAIAHKKTLLALLSLVTIATGTLSGCFFIGMLFGLMRREGGFERRDRSTRNTLITLAAILGVLAYPSYLMLKHRESASLLMLIAAGCSFLIYSDRGISAFLSRPFSQWLGRISFPLFLVHYAVIVSFTSWAIVGAAAAGGGSTAYAAIAFASFALAIACAVAFSPVERVAVRFSNAVWVGFERYFLSAPVAPSAPGA